MALDDASRRYLASQARGGLATVGPDGAPQNKPVGFVYNAELGTIDIAGFDMESSAKYRNVGSIRLSPSWSTTPSRRERRVRGS